MGICWRSCRRGLEMCLLWATGAGLYVKPYPLGAGKGKVERRWGSRAVSSTSTVAQALVGRAQFAEHVAVGGRYHGQKSTVRARYDSGQDLR